MKKFVMMYKDSKILKAKTSKKVYLRLNLFNKVPITKVISKIRVCLFFSMNSEP